MAPSTQLHHPTTVLGIHQVHNHTGPGGTKYQTYSTNTQTQPQQQHHSVPLPQLVFNASTGQTTMQTTQVAPTSRPTFAHHPHSFHSRSSSSQGAPQQSNRYAYVSTSASGQQTVTMLPTNAVQTYMPTGGVSIPRSMTPYQPQSAALQRVRQSEVGSHGGGIHRSSTGRRSSSTAQGPPSTPYVPSRGQSSLESDDSEDDDTGYTSAPPTSANYPYGGPITAPTPHVPRIISNGGGGGQPEKVVRPIMRKRTTSTNSSVHFTPDNLFLTFPSPHTMKLSNIPKFGSSSLMRALREKVITMWLPGVTFQKEGRGEYVVGFAGLGDGAMEPRGANGDSGLSETDRKNWGLWTARGLEGIA